MGFELIADRCRCYNPRPTSAFSVAMSAEGRKVETFQTLSALCMYSTEHIPAERYSTCSEMLHVESVSPISSSRAVVGWPRMLKLNCLLCYDPKVAGSSIPLHLESRTGRPSHGARHVRSEYMAIEPETHQTRPVTSKPYRSHINHINQRINSLARM
jgi:hypothetical protein